MTRNHEPRACLTALLLLAGLTGLAGAAHANQHGPQVTITSPSEEDPLEVGDEVDIRGTAEEGGGPIENVTVLVDGDDLNVQGTEEWEALWTPTEGGNYTIEAVVTDEDGETDADLVEVQVDDPDPIPTASSLPTLGIALSVAIGHRLLGTRSEIPSFK